MPFDYINIYELAHKCKEWAVLQDYYIEHGYESIQESFGAYCILRIYFDGDMIFNNFSGAEDYQKEPEAIFKACEWILEQTK